MNESEPALRQRLTFTLDQEISRAGATVHTEQLSMSPVPQLRVHDPDAPAPLLETSPPTADGDARRGWSLRRCWEEFVLPKSKIDGIAEATRTDHRTALNHWEAIFEPRQEELAEAFARANPGIKPPDPQENHRTIYPVVCQCDQYDLLHRYVQQMRKPVDEQDAVEERGRGLGYHQARKMLSAVKLILREARRRRLLAEIPDVVVGDPPRKKKPGQVVVKEVERLIRAAWQVAEWPKLGNIEPGYTWETWLLLFAIYGARTQDFVAYKSAKFDGLLWSEVHFDPECPDDAVRDDEGEPLRAPHGWLEWQPNKTARSKGELILMPLHSEVAKRLRRFVGLDPLRVFTHGRTKGNRQKGTPGFVTTWDAIVEAAGLGRDVTIAGTGAGTRSIRKGCSNNWDALHDGLGEWALGHARQGVHKSHYKDATRRFVAVIERLKIPRVEHLPLFDN